MLWDPDPLPRDLARPPTAPGRDRARRRRHGGRRRRNPSAWVHSTAIRSEPTDGRGPRRGPTRTPGREPAPPEVYKMAGITDPRRRARLRRDLRPVLLVMSRCGWEKPRASPAEGEGWKMVDDGKAPSMQGDMPIKPLRRCPLPSNPIGGVRHVPVRRGGASGARHGRRPSGSRMPHKALGHAYGRRARSSSRCGSVGSDPPQVSDDDYLKLRDQGLQSSPGGIPGDGASAPSPAASTPEGPRRLSPRTSLDDEGKALAEEGWGSGSRYVPPRRGPSERGLGHRWSPIPERDFGRVDVLVNNAGIPAVQRDHRHPDRGSWRRILDVQPDRHLPRE